MLASMMAGLGVGGRGRGLEWEGTAMAAAVVVVVTTEIVMGIAAEVAGTTTEALRKAEIEGFLEEAVAVVGTGRRENFLKEEEEERVGAGNGIRVRGRGRGRGMERLLERGG